MRPRPAGAASGGIARGIEIRMKFRRGPEPGYIVVLPRQAARPPRLAPPPMTIAPPLSGLLVPTANNRPDDPTSWQNEPGPGTGERPEAEIVRRDIAAMETVERVRLPAARAGAAGATIAPK